MCVCYGGRPPVNELMCAIIFLPQAFELRVDATVPLSLLRAREREAEDGGATWPDQAGRAAAAPRDGAAPLRTATKKKQRRAKRKSRTGRAGAEGGLDDDSDAAAGDSDGDGGHGAAAEQQRRLGLARSASRRASAQIAEAQSAEAAGRVLRGPCTVCGNGVYTDQVVVVVARARSFAREASERASDRRGVSVSFDRVAVVTTPLLVVLARGRSARATRGWRAGGRGAASSPSAGTHHRRRHFGGATRPRVVRRDLSSEQQRRVTVE